MGRGSNRRRMPSPILQRVSAVRTTSAQGTFYRHAAVGRDAFAGGDRGRWGADFPVIYLASSVQAALAEAYRHLVDEAGVPPHAVRPRHLYTAAVAVTEVVDLTAPAALEGAGLSAADLTSDPDDYIACQQVAAAAHDLGRHGILAPAAHGLGLTLALFKDHLDPSELPVVDQDATTLWDGLPPDPRPSRP